MFTSNLYGLPNENFRDLSKDLGGGYLINAGETQTSYMGTDLIDFLKLQPRPAPDSSERNLMLDQAYSFNYMMGGSSQLNSNPAASSQAKPKPSSEPKLYIRVKEENESLKLRVDQLELDLAAETKKVNELERRNERLHGKLEGKDKSISKLRDNLKRLKDDIQIVNENIAQAKSSAAFIKAEDESLQELASELLILLEDCFKKTVVKEDERGNMTIGALNFHDEELLLVNQYNREADSSVSTTEELLHEIQISLQQRIQAMTAQNFNLPSHVSLPAKTVSSRTQTLETVGDNQAGSPVRQTNKKVESEESAKFGQAAGGNPSKAVSGAMNKKTNKTTSRRD